MITCSPPRNWRPSSAATQASAHEYSSSRASPSMPYFFRNRPDTILQHPDRFVNTLLSTDYLCQPAGSLIQQPAEACTNATVAGTLQRSWHLNPSAHHMVAAPSTRPTSRSSQLKLPCCVM